MYTTRNRFTGRKSFSGAGRNTSGPYLLSYSTPSVLEGVYSWRTGRSNIDPPGTPPVKQRDRLDGFGIITPSQKGSFLDRLADRKRYMEDFQRAAFPAETDAGSFSTSRVSSTDTGHLFASNKTLRFPYCASYDWYSNSSANYAGDVVGSVGGGAVINPSPYSFGYPSETTSPLVVSPSGRQATANRYFAATAPDRNGATLGVTLIELLRGDVPSVLKNFREMMAGYKTVRNYVGSDALNIMFGWTPLIQEYANLIKVGMNLERVIYYESFRRKRQWDGPTYNSSDSPLVTLSSTGSAYGASSLILPGEVVGPNVGAGISFQTERRTVAVEDYHFSSKYTGLAKAGRRANSFSDQAMDVVKRLGLVDDPTLLWDLTPYSWLVDWFTTMGDSLSNAHTYAPMSGKYTVDYAYLTTKHSVSTDGYLLRRNSTPTGFRSLSVTSAHSVSYSVTKWRSRATPFGFGTQLGSLSASQFAILVALGFAKTR